MIRGRLRAQFVTGLIVILPLGLTFLVIWFLVSKVGGGVAWIIDRIPVFESMSLHPVVLTALGFFITLAIVWVVGLLASSFLGGWFFRLVNAVMSRLPLVRVVYTSARQLTETLFSGSGAFRRVVMLEYPRKGVYTFAFVTSHEKWRMGGRVAVSVFLPTAPNPTSGFYLLIPEDEIIKTRLTVEEAMKLIVSGGMVVPPVREIDIDE